MSTVSSRPAVPEARGLHVRLPWWAVALAVLSFSALLILIALPTDTPGTGAAQSLTSLYHFLGRAFPFGA
ncbi:hypothetical protein [Streptomyces sp. NPDC003077]|uniref:hypothetical protein n=1 Tax=Streptomyces sp. NPDC003077 TaxID=3154443 RepID=UPI0033B0FCC6